MGTETVTCPHCGAETKVTVGRTRTVEETTTERDFALSNPLEEGATTATECADGHRFYVRHIPRN